MLFPLLTAVLILVELTETKIFQTSEKIFSTKFSTVIGNPLGDDVDVVLVSGQQVGVVDELLRVGALSGDDHDAVVPDNGGEVVLVPEPGHGEALQQVRAAQQLEGDGALGGGAEGGQPVHSGRGSGVIGKLRVYVQHVPAVVLLLIIRL